MKKKFSVEQIVSVLKQAEVGVTIAELIRKVGIWFQTLPEAKLVIQAWQQEYNVSRPQRALADRTPAEFASQIAASRDLAETKTRRELTF